MYMNKKIILLLVGLLLIPSLVYGDRIHLTNGTVIDGKIISEDRFQVKIEVFGVPKSYYKYKVKSIERDDEYFIDTVSEEFVGEFEIPGKDAIKSREKRELVFRLFEANGGRESMVTVFNHLVAQAPEDTRDELKAILKVDEIIEELVEVYSTYYFEEELIALVEFYKSSPGRKHVQLTPILMEATLEKTTKYFERKIDEHNREVEDQQKEFEKSKKLREKIIEERKDKERDKLKKGSL